MTKKEQILRKALEDIKKEDEKVLEKIASSLTDEKEIYVFIGKNFLSKTFKDLGEDLGYTKANVALIYHKAAKRCGFEK